jgi:hypothetical protein
LEKHRLIDVLAGLNVSIGIPIRIEEVVCREVLLGLP